MHQLQFCWCVKFKLNKMIVIIVLCMTLLGHLSMAMPLDSPAANITQYFDSRIVGGSVAPEGSSPYKIALIIGEYFRSFVCGGSIITKRHGLTAAHCITSFVDWDGNILRSFHGRVGTLTWNHGGVIITFIAFENHPAYNPTTLKNDVGVLTFANEIKFTPGINAIALHQGYVGGGASCFVAGWGTEWLWGIAPDHLKILYVNTLSEVQCRQLINDISSSSWPPPPLDYSVEICTFHSFGHGMCHGDSGSALVLTKNRKQSGIVSWGFPCAIGGPDVFVRLTKPIIKFIKNVLGLNYRLLGDA